MYIFIALILSILSILFIYRTLFKLTINHKNFKKRKLNANYYIITFINTIISVLIFTLIFYNNKFLFSEKKMIDLKSIVFYLIVADTFLYWYHSLSHRIPQIKNFLHSMHHNAFNLIPLDIFYINKYELLINIFILNISPLLILNISIIEYIILISIIFIHSIYIHYETDKKFLPLFITSKYHKNHHQIGKGNYAILTIWDNFMDTIINPEKKIKHKSKR